MGDNQRLLEQLTVSSPKLDKLISAALTAGAVGAKLSGGGRGNMIALAPTQNTQSIESALLEAGATRSSPQHSTKVKHNGSIPLVFLKLGGSLITDKTKPLTPAWMSSLAWQKRFLQQ